MTWLQIVTLVESIIPGLKSLVDAIEEVVTALKGNTTPAPPPVK
jgi:hypothetical protein